MNIGHAPEHGSGRDAIHVPIVPMVAGETLVPGQWVKLGAWRDDKVYKCHITDQMAIGIADPFSRQEWHDGDRMWVLLPPGTITVLKHSWQHPLLDSMPGSHSAAEWRLHVLAKRLGIDYTSMMYMAGLHLEDGKVLYDWTFEGIGVPDTFWTDYALVTGEEGVADRVEEIGDYFFSCGGCGELDGMVRK